MKRTNGMAKVGRRMVMAWVLALSIVSSGTVWADKEDKPDRFVLPSGEIVGTGCKRPSAEEKKASDERMVKTGDVKLNALGFERLNRDRKEKGERELGRNEVEIVEVGQEVVAAPAGPSDGTRQVSAGGAPAYVDNTVLKYFPPIRSQGSLGSCAQFSAIYYTFTHMTALARDWDAKNGGDSYRFSPKWTYNMLNGGENVGTWPDDGYAIAQTHGVATWAEFPYDGNYRAWCLAAAVWRNAINVRADQMGTVTSVNGTGLTKVKQLLANGYILNFCTYIDSWQWSTIKNDPATTVDDSYAGQSIVACVNGVSGGHAMTIVGYDDAVWVDLDNDNAVDSAEKGAFLIANSWGTGWGMGGLCWISYNAVQARNPARSSTEGIFWFDEATWLTARATYTPRLVAKFTMNTVNREGFGVNILGVSATSSSTPTTYWYPWVLQSGCGPYAFDGGTAAVDGSFCLDFTDLASANASMQRYFLQFSEGSGNYPVTLKAYSLLDVARGTEIACPAVPRIANGSTVNSFVDYDLASGAAAPLSIIQATPTTGNLPLAVTFDGSGSADPDGTIVSYAWTFGDGGTASGATAAHTYSSAGTYTATLTVTDNAGAKGSSSVTITVIDPTVVNAPTALTATASGSGVYLVWTDNSANETGFYVERAVKSGKSFGSYARVATLAANTTRYNEVVAAGTYSYRVQAFNSVAGKTSAYSNVAQVTRRK